MSDKIAVVGAGPAGLMAADVASAAGCDVTVYEAMPSPARKLLMAGKSGLNLTYEQPLDAFLARYGHVSPASRQAIESFGPDAMKQFAADLGQEVFTGSSGRVFPKAMKASPLARAWLARLAERGVRLLRRHRLTGLASGPALDFETPEGPLTVRPDAAILAMGGGSWARLGSTGAWAGFPPLEGHCDPFVPSNCGVRIDWPVGFTERFAGTPLKTVRLSAAAGAERLEKSGDAMVVAGGLEGGTVYEICRAFRTASEDEPWVLYIDLVPGRSLDKLTEALARPRGKQSLSNHLRKAAKLPPEKLALLLAFAPQGTLSDSAGAARQIKSLGLPVTGLAALDGAISTAGGLRQADLDGFALPFLPGVYAAGEMLDWDAPTGGYLLTGCLATGRAAALQAVRQSGPDNQSSGPRAIA